MRKIPTKKEVGKGNNGDKATTIHLKGRGRKGQAYGKGDQDYVKTSMMSIIRKEEDVIGKDKSIAKEDHESEEKSDSIDVLSLWYGLCCSKLLWTPNDFHPVEGQVEGQITTAGRSKREESRSRDGEGYHSSQHGVGDDGIDLK